MALKSDFAEMPIVHNRFLSSGENACFTAALRGATYTPQTTLPLDAVLDEGIMSPFEGVRLKRKAHVPHNRRDVIICQPPKTVMIAVHHARQSGRKSLLPRQCGARATRRLISALNLIVEPAEVAYSALQQLVHIAEQESSRSTIQQRLAANHGCILARRQGALGRRGRARGRARSTRALTWTTRTRSAAG